MYPLTVLLAPLVAALPVAVLFKWKAYESNRDQCVTVVLTG